MKKENLKLISKLYFLGLFVMLLTVGIVWVFKKWHHQKESVAVLTPCINLELKPQNELERLDTKINFYEQKLKETTDVATKENLNQIKTAYQKQKTNLENRNLYDRYASLLEEQIEELNQQLANNKQKLTTKHALTTKKLKKEKELITLQEQEKLLQEEEMETVLLPEVEKKLKNTELSSDDKQKLVTEKNRLEKK